MTDRTAKMLHRNHARYWTQALKLLDLDPTEAVQLLTLEERPRHLDYVRTAQRWLDGYEAALQRPDLKVVDQREPLA